MVLIWLGSEQIHLHVILLLLWHKEILKHLAEVHWVSCCLRAVCSALTAGRCIWPRGADSSEREGQGCCWLLWPCLLSLSDPPQGMNSGSTRYWQNDTKQTHSVGVRGGLFHPGPVTFPADMQVSHLSRWHACIWWFGDSGLPQKRFSTFVLISVLLHMTSRPSFALLRITVPVTFWQQHCRFKFNIVGNDSLDSRKICYINTQRCNIL